MPQAAQERWRWFDPYLETPKFPLYLTPALEALYIYEWLHKYQYYMSGWAFSIQFLLLSPNPLPTSGWSEGGVLCCCILHDLERDLGEI